MTTRKTDEVAARCTQIADAVARVTADRFIRWHAATRLRGVRP